MSLWGYESIAKPYVEPSNPAGAQMLGAVTQGLLGAYRAKTLADQRAQAMAAAQAKQDALEAYRGRVLAERGGYHGALIQGAEADRARKGEVAEGLLEHWQGGAERGERAMAMREEAARARAADLQRLRAESERAHAASEALGTRRLDISERLGGGRLGVQRESLRSREETASARKEAIQRAAAERERHNRAIEPPPLSPRRPPTEAAPSPALPPHTQTTPGGFNEFRARNRHLTDAEAARRYRIEQATMSLIGPVGELGAGPAP